MTRFRIKNPVTALSFEEGREVPYTVPTGACIAVDNAVFDGDQLHRREVGTV